jgi:hypothetical protein
MQHMALIFAACVWLTGHEGVPDMLARPVFHLPSSILGGLSVGMMDFPCQGFSSLNMKRLSKSILW